MNWLLLALGSMFVQQTFVALGKVLPAIIAPAVFLDLQIDPALLGVYVSLTSGGGVGCAKPVAAVSSCVMERYGLVSLLWFPCQRALRWRRTDRWLCLGSPR